MSPYLSSFSMITSTGSFIGAPFASPPASSLIVVFACRQETRSGVVQGRVHLSTGMKQWLGCTDECNKWNDDRMPASTSEHEGNERKGIKEPLCHFLGKAGVCCVCSEQNSEERRQPPMMIVKSLSSAAAGRPSGVTNRHSSLVLALPSLHPASPSTTTVVPVGQRPSSVFLVRGARPWGGFGTRNRQ